MSQHRNRMIFETDELVKRAIRVRAAVDGVHPSTIINEGMRLFLAREIGELSDQAVREDASPRRRGRTGVTPNGETTISGR